MMKHANVLFAAIAGASLLAGCKQQGGAAGPPALPADSFLASAPTDPLDVRAAKEQLKKGDQVVLRGRIGGSPRPFTEGRAVFTIVDVAVPSCADDPTDKCPTPWDYCCEDRAVMSAGSATVQFVDDKGAPLRAKAEGVGGLTPLTEVLVVGTVAETDNRTTLVVNATGIFVSAPAGF